MSFILTPEITNIHRLPREYNMAVTDQNTINTFVFSEKDLPGYRKYSHDRPPPRSKDRKRVEKPRGPGMNFRKAVPSMSFGLGRFQEKMLICSETEQTNLVGQIRTEVNCLPVENTDFQQYVFRENKRREAEKPKIKMMKDNDDNNVVIPGNLASSGQFGDLIVSALSRVCAVGEVLMRLLVNYWTA